MANDLVISVGASIRDLERQMKAAARVSEQAANDIEAQFNKRNPSFAGDFGLGVLKGAIAGIAFDRIIRGFMEANREIAAFGDTARRVGLDLAKFQELRLAAAGQGVGGKQFDAGVDGLAKALNDARREETELTKLLDANGVKYKDRKGEIISTNEALGVAADLISRAATEQDKIELAKRFGLPADFVPLLENGAAALETLRKNAAEAGTILDSDVIAKAKQFDIAWASGWASFESNAKAAVFAASQGLGSLIAKAGEYLKAVNAANAAQSQSSERRARRDEAHAMGLANAGGRSAVNAEQAAEARKRDAGFRQDEIQYRNSLKTDQTLPSPRPGGLVAGKQTTIPTKSSGGGGGGGSSKGEDEQAQARLERYIETLMRQNSVLDAEISTVGKSNAEKRAAVELAKAQVDLSKLDEESRKKIIADLTREIELSEQKRTKLKELQDAQKGLIDAQKFFGNAAVDALEDLIINGGKAEDVIKNLTKALAKAALQAALMGTGPLAGIFGTAGANGATGGIFGAIFGKATGGHVNAGQAYDVGERGKERFVPTVPGKIIPNNKLGGGGVTVAFTIDARGATPDAIAMLRVEMAQQRAALPGIIMQTQTEARRRGASS